MRRIPSLPRRQKAPSLASPKTRLDEFARLQLFFSFIEIKCFLGYFIDIPPSPKYIICASAGQVRNRLMVGHLPLEEVILVRVQVPQQLTFM